MPSRYYCLISPQKKIAFYFLDSNTFPFDEQQQDWLQQVYERDEGYKRILVMHHPILPAGKRFGSTHDADMYLKAYGLSGKADVGEMGQWCAKTLYQKGLTEFRYVLSAHDHCMAIEKTSLSSAKGLWNLGEDTIQIISGGGGAPLSLSDKSVTSYLSGEQSDDEVKMGGALRKMYAALSGRGYSDEQISLALGKGSDGFRFYFKHGYVWLDVINDRAKVFTFDYNDGHFLGEVEEIDFTQALWSVGSTSESGIST